jgi:hypothetical protein
MSFNLMQDLFSIRNDKSFEGESSYSVELSKIFSSVTSVAHVIACSAGCRFVEFYCFPLAMCDN